MATLLMVSLGFILYVCPGYPPWIVFCARMVPAQDALGDVPYPVCQLFRRIKQDGISPQRREQACVGLCLRCCGLHLTEGGATVT